ncbi:MAG: glycosyltransferase family 9 protein [Opitutaceae bacterium]|nr:glycosyltransferase family 9 protein [Verrucomicrobiales bacterium]
MSGSAKILVIRGGAIGDFILTLPVFAALREQFPVAHLEVLAYPNVTTLATAGGLADAARSIEARALAGFFARDGDLDEELSEYFASFAIIVSYLYDPDDIFKTNVGRCSRAQFIQGPHRPDEKRKLHATEVLLQPLERLAIFAPDPVPRLRISVGQQSIEAQTSQNDPGAMGLPDRRDARFTGETIALHPGSGSEQKNWPETKWSELLQWLMENSNQQLVLVGGEAEGDRLQRLSSKLPADRVELYQSRPLIEVAGRLSDCNLFIGHDSGISHLAAAVGLRSCVLWGETAEAIWRPRGDHVTILRESTGLASLATARVIEEFRRLRVTG